MYIHSIDLPRISAKDNLYILCNAIAYVAIGLWTIVAPQAIAQSDMSNHAEPVSLEPHITEHNDGVPIKADDLERPPAYLQLPPNANNFDLLFATEKNATIAPFFPSRATTGGKKLTLNLFEKAEVCAGCHGEIYNEWKDSVMANSWDDPIYRALLAKASAATEGKVDKLCIGCHTPMGLTTDSVSAVGEDKVHISGIGCDDCHSISASTGLGNGSYVLTPKQFGRPLKFGPNLRVISQQTGVPISYLI